MEIMKYTLPSVVVFATAFFMLREMLEDRRNQLNLSKKQDAQRTTLPLRLQAYERFALLCERFNLPSLVMRTRMPDMTARDLSVSLLINIQREFEFNAPQQVYVSETLWKIIAFAVQDAVEQVAAASKMVDPDGPAEALVEAISANAPSPEKPGALQQAQSAIRLEANSLF